MKEMTFGLATDAQIEAAIAFAGFKPARNYSRGALIQLLRRNKFRAIQVDGRTVRPIKSVGKQYIGRSARPKVKLTDGRWREKRRHAATTILV